MSTTNLCLCGSDRERRYVFCIPQLPSPQSLQSLRDKGSHMCPKENLIHLIYKRKELKLVQIWCSTQIQKEKEKGETLTDHHPNTVQSDHLHQLPNSQCGTEWNSDLHLLICNMSFHQTTLGTCIPNQPKGWTKTPDFPEDGLFLDSFWVQDHAAVRMPSCKYVTHTWGNYILYLLTTTHVVICTPNYYTQHIASQNTNGFTLST